MNKEIENIVAESVPHPVQQGWQNEPQSTSEIALELFQQTAPT